MQLAFGLRRLGFAIAAVVLAAVGLLALASHLVPVDSVREAVSAEIRAATGFEPIIRGDVSLSLFPSSTVTFGSVALGTLGKDPALEADSVVARLRLWPLVLGRIEAAEITLVQPSIAITIDPDGQSNWSSVGQQMASVLKPTADRSSLSFSEIRIVGGRLAYRDQARKISEDLTDLEVSLAWPAISKSFGASGRFTWRLEPIEATVSLGDLYATLVGERSGLKVRMTGAPIKLAFEGSLAHRPALKIEGVLSADGPSVRNVAQWLGQELPQGSGFGRYALKAQINVVGGSVSLPQLIAEVDGNAAEGVLTVSATGRPAIQGTLAAENIDFTPYLSAMQIFRGREREWSRSRINLDSLRNMDIDVRFSAARLQIANARLTRIAAAANLADGRLTLTLGESAAFGGLVKGSIALQPLDKGAEIKSQLQFSDVDVEACLAELFGIRRLEGRGNLVLAVEASGDTVLALTRTLSGSADLDATKGALAGLNVEQLLRRLERRPLSGGGAFRTGRTAFERLKVKLKIAQGTASIEDVSLDGNAVRLAIAGSASIPTRDLDLKGTASLVTPSSNTAFDLPFVVQGPWDDPIMLPDPQILIRRSGAAKALFDLKRDTLPANEKVSQPNSESRLPAAAPAAAAPLPAAPSANSVAD